MNGSEQHSGPVASHVTGHVGAVAPWSDRTSASHWHADREWAVIVDWAETSDGTRVPAAVTISCLGATLGEATAPNVEPAPVTRALVDSVPWATVIATSRDRLDNLAGGDWSALRQYGQPTQPAGPAPSEHHDQLLQLVARIYAAKGGHGTRGIARRVHAELSSRGVQPMRRGPKPEHDAELPEGEVNLSEETVRRWISEARRRGYIPPIATQPNDN